MKKFKNILLILLVTSFAFTSCSSDDGPSGPDYTTYSFSALPTAVELEGPDYSFTVTLNRSASAQADLIDLAITDVSGKFVLASSSVSFAVGESSKTITVQPTDASTVSIYETYDITVSVVVPVETASTSKNIEAGVLVNWVAEGDGNIDYGWLVAAVVSGGPSKTIEVEKDSNDDYSKCIDAYGTGFDIFFGINDNGEVVIEDGQAMYLFAGALIGLTNDFQMNMTVNSAVYDATTKTVTLNYDQVRDDEQPIFRGVPFGNITDVIILP